MRMVQDREEAAGTRRSLRAVIITALCRRVDRACYPEVSGEPRKGFRQKGKAVDCRKVTCYNTWKETSLETRRVGRELQQLRKAVAKAKAKARVEELGKWRPELYLKDGINKLVRGTG